MKQAISSVKENKMGLNQAAKHFDIPKATLIRHLKIKIKLLLMEKIHLGRVADLLNEIENQLAQDILNMESRLRKNKLSLNYSKTSFIIFNKQPKQNL